MENIKLPYVGETLWTIINGTIKSVIINTVEYIDTKSARTVKIRTNKGMIELWDLFDTENEAKIRLELKGLMV